MNDLISELKKTISKKAQKSVLVCESESFIKIKECDPSAKLKAIAIDTFKKDDSFFAFTLDVKDYKQLSLYINRENYNKGCDGVVVLLREDKIYVLLCELKSGRSKPKDYANQLKSSEAYLFYIFQALEVFGDFTCLKGNIKYVRLLFDTKFTNRGFTTPSNNKPSPIRENIYRCDCLEGDKTKYGIDYLLKCC